MHGNRAAWRGRFSFDDIASLGIGAAFRLTEAWRAALFMAIASGTIDAIASK